MEYRRVDSSSINRIGYDAKTSKLAIEFKEGSRYEYDAVSPAVFDAFLRAESKGRFFHERIDGKYRYSRLPY